METRTYQKRRAFVESISVIGEEETRSLLRVIYTTVSRVRKREAAVEEPLLSGSTDRCRQQEWVDPESTELTCIMPLRLAGPEPPGMVVFGFQ